MKYFKYEIDIDSNIPFDVIMKSLTAGSLRLELYERVGPGGGNQRFIIAGRYQDWDAWCTQNYSEDPESHRIGEIDA
jgi:hypothetical protein